MGSLAAITPFSLSDYPGETACIAWFSGCNLRCLYCHNPNLVMNRGEKPENELIAFLEKRRGLLSAVVFSGGEATLCPTLPALARQAKALGYKTKLDTNGATPDMLTRLFEERLIDYVALDYKCPASRAEALLGTDKFVTAFEASLKQLVAYSHDGLNLEIRTTYHADWMNEDELTGMIDDLDRLNYRGTYYIQNIFAYGEQTLGKIEKPVRRFDREKLPRPKNFKLAFRNFPDAVKREKIAYYSRTKKIP